MKSSFDIGDFLEDKEFDIAGRSYKDIFPSTSGSEAGELTNKFLYAVVEILLDFINQTNDRDANVLDFHHPSQITKAMDFSLPDTGLSLDQVVGDCRAALRYQVKTGHPHFFNQLSQGLDIVSMAGEWLAATANANMFTYEIAPVFIMMEHEVTDDRDDGLLAALKNLVLITNITIQMNLQIMKSKKKKNNQTF